MRPLRNINTKHAASHAFSFSRNSSSATTSQPQFFSPSYLSPRDLVRLNEVGFNNAYSSSNKNSSNRSIFKYVAPTLSVTRNYNNLIHNDDSNHHINSNENVLTLENNLHHFLKNKNNHRSFSIKLNNKNNYLNISINKINANYTILNIRRANSTNIKQITIPNSIRNLSTINDNDLIKDFKNLNLSDNSIDNSIDKPKIDYNDPVQIQSLLVDQFQINGKFNEILPLYHRMRNNQIIPDLNLYNKILNSIKFRQTDENLETKLTHLLNIYSDMLSNNIKPSMETYNLVIDQLINGSLESYKLQNYKNGYDFFKIAFELFIINKENNNYFSSQININIINCLNLFKIKDLINVDQLLSIMESNISNNDKLTFYLKLIKFSSILNDSNSIEKIYNNKIKLLNSIDNHNLIYQSLIEAYNISNNLNKASLLLDSIINNFADKDLNESKIIMSNYLSIYIKSLSIVNPYIAMKMIFKFNKINWLPDYSIDSLILLSNEFLRINDLTSAIKIWNLIIMRKDLNNLNNLPIDDYSIFISNYINYLTNSILITNDKNLIVKITRELLTFNNLKINNENLINLIYFIKSIDNNLTINLILNQGYKRLIDKQSINNYISLIVDLLNENQLQLLFNSKFFKRVIEEFRLLNDNIYGILKIFNSNIPFDKLKLKYYSKVLAYEFNDHDNVYVTLPKEVQNFKSYIQKYLAPDASLNEN